MYINTFDGSKTATVVAKYTVQAEFTVGGVDDEDRIDSVKEMFEDHYDDIVKNSFLRDAITSMVLDSVVVKNDDSSPCPRYITGNMCQWLADLLDPAINDARIAAENEHIWANGSEDPEDAGMHENNAEELKQYVELLKDIKARYVG